MLYEVTRTMETPLLTHLDRIDAIEIFSQEHRPALNYGELHILINWQDALKYTLDTKTKTLYLLSRDNKADDEYNKIVFDEMQAAYKVIDQSKLSKKEEKKQAATDSIQEKYPQKQHIIKTPVKFTYGEDMKDLLSHPILSTVL